MLQINHLIDDIKFQLGALKGNSNKKIVVSQISEQTQKYLVRTLEMDGKK